MLAFLANRLGRLIETVFCEVMEILSAQAVVSNLACATLSQVNISFYNQRFGYKNISQALNISRTA